MKNAIGTFLITCLIHTSFGKTYAAPGDLDAQFGVGGRVTTYFSFANALDMVVQPDGKILAVGYGGGSANPIALARYNADGSPDNGFGIGGKVVTTVGQFNEARGVALLPDGRIVVGGSVCMFGPACDFVVVRYLADGGLDTSFDFDGKVTIVFGNDDSGNDIAIQADGKIVIIGSSGVAGARNYSFAVARLNTDGALDTTFDSDGKAITSLGSYSDSGASAVVIQPDARIIVAGERGVGPGFSATDFALVRYQPNGSLDMTFDGDGIVITSVTIVERFSDVTVQSDGHIVGVGCTGGDAAVIRYKANGLLDSKFAGDGIVLTGIGGCFSSVSLQPDGKIVTGGHNSEHVVCRYTSYGVLDSSFGGDGIVTTVFGNQEYPEYFAYGGINDIAIQSNGKIVGAGGWGVDGKFSVFALARYLGDGAAPDSTRFDFDGDGRSDVSVFRPSDSVWYVDRSTAGFTSVQFGLSTDEVTPADFDGDGKTDIAVFREGAWWLINSSNSTFTTIPFGVAGDIPVPADYTADGRDDLAVYRSGTWWVCDLSNNHTSVVDFGLAGDEPVPADYDGDGRADQAVFRNGEWHLNRSSLGYTVANFGITADIPVVGDYDGDGKSDLGVYRGGTWYVFGSNRGFTAFTFGLPTDVPVPGDYDGDGKTDAAVYRDGVWYVRKSTGGVSIQQFGLTGDRPIPSAFLP